jgi:hypothetical protein
MAEPRSEFALADQDLQLVELVNRVLDRGAVITGEITISVAGIDLVFLGLQLVVASAETARGRPGLGRRLR